MSRKNMFLFSTVAQTNYFAQVGRLIAKGNYSKSGPKRCLRSKDDNDNTFCVIIRHTYEHYNDLITTVRRAWMINIDEFRKKHIEHVFAIYENVIVGVYKLAKDNPIVESYEPNRWEFNLQLADLTMQQKWLGIELDGNSLKGGECHYAYFETE